MVKKTFYPAKIEADYTTRPTPTANATGCKAMRQAMKGKNNLKSGDNTIAYWGDRAPDKTHSQDPLRYYPNTITTFSGTWNIPSAFTVTDWSIPSSIPEDSIVNKITLEYAITHIQYLDQYVKNAGWAYDSEGCKFYKSEVQNGAGDVRAESGGLAKNCETPYTFTLNFNGKHTVSGQGLKYSQRTTDNLDVYPSSHQSSKKPYDSVMYHGNNNKWTIKQLKKADLRVVLPRNLNWDIGRIVMRFVRLNVEYTEIPPKFKIESLTVSPSTITTCPNSKAKVTVKIKSTNGHTGDVNVKLSGDGIKSATISKVSDSKNFKNYIWTAKKFSKKGEATLSFYVLYKKAKKYTITATVQSSSASKKITVNSCKPNFDFLLLKDIKTKEGDIETHTPGGVYSYTSHKLECSDQDNKSGFFKVIFNKDAANSDNEYITINTDGLDIVKWGGIDGDILTSNITHEEGTYIWTLKNINQKTSIILHGLSKFTKAGVYAVTATYTNKTHPSFNKTIKYEIIVKGTTLGKEYFKMRLEDGSDVRYNSLMFTKGDDLKIPLTYTTEDEETYQDYMIIKGGKKRIPINEIQYVDFKIDFNIDEDIELKNVLTYFEVVSDGMRCDDTIVGASKNVTLKENDDGEKIGIIHSIKSNTTTTIRLAMQSDIQRECYVYIKPYNINEPYTYINDDKTYIHKLVDGDATIDTSTLVPGHYAVTVQYTGDNKYDGITKKINIKVPKNKTNTIVTIKNEDIGIEPDATGRLNITVHSRKWTPAHVLFKDIPNIKIWIEGVSEVDTAINNKFSLYYHIQNLSEVEGKNIRFQIKEPHNFNKIGYSLYKHNDNNEYKVENGRDSNAPWFNENNRIITFPVLEKQSIQQDYRLRIDYQATTKGIYDFIIKTLDSPDDVDDDQYQNYYKHQVLVDIPSKVKISTKVSKKMPYVDELIDFHIDVKNQLKDQKTFIFNIYDAGRYETAHDANHYGKPKYIICKYGKFIPSTNEDNMIGTWILNDIKADTEYDLTLTLNPEASGLHVIKTVFYDNDTTTANTQDFENVVKVLERKKQIDFNVYQAVSDTDANCSHCNDLIPICDNDFINLNDKIYYVFEIKNNNRKPIENTIHVYARLPESFLTNGVLCSSRTYNISSENNLLEFSIPGLGGCNDLKDHQNTSLSLDTYPPTNKVKNGETIDFNAKFNSKDEEKSFENKEVDFYNTDEEQYSTSIADSKVMFCIKLQPNDVGDFISNFSMTTRGSNVLTKQLKLTVDTEFNERKLEHEINIYNFEKTNKYYRYEIDNTGEIFKFYNTGDKSVRLIDHEQHNNSSIETYRGTNLRRIVKDIQKNSKYVDPLFLREGSNKLNDKGYELYPDGLIRRFGLLKSEIFHYSHQFPQTSNLVKRAMKWDIDPWDTKVWGGDIYDNGVFDLTIDYAKIPSNFNILKPNEENDYNPIKKLQALVDDVKPYGTQALCYYSATIPLRLQMFIHKIDTLANYNEKLQLKIPEDKLGVISEYSRHDKSLAIYYDMFRLELSAAIKDIHGSIEANNNKADEYGTITPNIKEISTTVYNTKTNKKYIQDCYDIISNIYSTKEKNNNIDITKKYNPKDFKNSPLPANLINQQIINFTNNLENNQKVGLKLEENKTSTIYTYNTNFSDGILTVPDTNDILFTFEKDGINYFQGFKVTIEDEVISSYNIVDPTEKVSMQIQLCEYEDYKVLHFWGSINEQDYCHIGHLLSTGINKPIIKSINKQTDDIITGYSCDVDNPLIFKLSDRINLTTKQFDYIESMERNNKWEYLKNINNNKGKYAYFKNKIDIDPECGHNKVNVPKLIFKYNNIDLDDTDEIVDIAFKVEAQSNKKDFAEKININLYKDGDAYIPTDNIAKKIYYPENITNAIQEFLATMQVEVPNITMCSECMKTSLGYYDECQYCGSTNVYHTNEKIAATVCHNGDCGYITKGWHDTCPHCLSYDIDKVKIDYNKTYCTECHTTTDDYYNHCPHCFSPNVIHLTNDKHTYRIFDKDTQNIDPINISVMEKKVNIFNIEVPFSQKTPEINRNALEYINLTVHGTNNNNGEYYYCESCGVGGLGNYDICPHCSSQLTHNYRISNNNIEIYYEDGNGIKLRGTEPIAMNFETQVELQNLGLNNIYSSFNLLFYIDNQSYNDISNIIMELPIDEEYQSNIIEGLMKMDITIDNLSLDYKYKNQNEWVGLDRIYNSTHTGITSTIPYNRKTTDSIRFNHFNIPNDKYKHAYLYLHGIAKHTNTFKINFKITNNKKVYQYQTDALFNDVFNYQLDLVDVINKDAEDVINKNIGDVDVEVFFSESTPGAEIIITDCNILTEKNQSTHILHDGINKIDTTIKEEHGYYLLSSSNNDIWGINQTQPYYLSGRQLDTNLIGYMDFGELDLNEYIRLYNIEMMILYKNKIGQIITENIPIQQTKETDTLPTGAVLPDDNYYTEQNFNGDIERINGEAWLSLKYPMEILNNLEYDITNINDSDELLNAIPLHNKLAQSFILKSSEISRISIKSYRNRGYPNDIINVYLCEDDNNKPGTIIRANKAKIDAITKVLDIDLDATDLTKERKYWFVIEDVHADEYNYHQFEYNHNNEIGQLIRYENNKAIYDGNCVLSFNIDTNAHIKDIYDLPIFWSIDEDDAGIEYDSYKMCMTFYRYNIQNNSNISASNLYVNYGYKIIN